MRLSSHITFALLGAVVGAVAGALLVMWTSRPPADGSSGPPMAAVLYTTLYVMLGGAVVGGWATWSGLRGIPRRRSNTSPSRLDRIATGLQVLLALGLIGVLALMRRSGWGWY